MTTKKIPAKKAPPAKPAAAETAPEASGSSRSSAGPVVVTDAFGDGYESLEAMDAARLSGLDEIAKLQQKIRDAQEEVSRLDAQHKRRFPPELEPTAEQVFQANQAHLRASQAKVRAQRANQLEALKAADIDLAKVAEIAGGSRLDRVLKQRGKDPALRRKFVPPKAAGGSQE